MRAYVEKNTAKVVKQIETQYYKYKQVAEGYRQVEWVKATEKAWTFDTGLAYTNKYSLECCRAWTELSNWTYAMYPNSTAANNWYILGYEDSSVGLSLHYRKTCYSLLKNPNANQFYTISTDFSTSTKKGFVDGLQLFTLSDTGTYNAGNSGAVLRCAILISTKDKYFKVFDPSMNLIRHYIPCVRMEDNTVGLYEVVNGEFFTDDTKTFEVGDFISEPATEDDYDYSVDAPVYKLVKNTVRKYYKIILNEYTLPAMSSYTSDKGFIVTNFSEPTYESVTYYVWRPFWGVRLNGFNQDYSSNGYRYVQYNFYNAIIEGIYTLYFYYNRQNNVTSTGTQWEVVYDDNTKDIIWTYTTEKNQYITIQFTATKPIKAIIFSIASATSSASSQGYEGLGNVNLTLEGKDNNTVAERVIMQGTEDDYDYYIDVDADNI